MISTDKGRLGELGIEFVELSRRWGTVVSSDYYPAAPRDRTLRWCTAVGKTIVCEPRDMANGLGPLAYGLWVSLDSAIRSRSTSVIRPAVLGFD